MSSQNTRNTRSLFRTNPEDGAQVADLAEALVPGGRGFVQQLFRAKKDFLKGVSHLVEAQIDECEDIDKAIADEARRRPPPASTQAGAPRSNLRVMSFGEVMQKAGELFSWGSRSSQRYGQRIPSRQYIPEPPRPSDRGPTQASAGSTGDRPSPEAPEKIKIT